MLRIIACSLLIFSASSLRLRADGGSLPDFYKATSLEGYVKFAGKRFDLPLGALRAALLKDGKLVVKDHRIPVHAVKWTKVLEKFHFKGISGSSVASGPSDVVLKLEPDGSYHGSARKPLVIVQRGKYHFVKVTVTLRTHLDTTITDGHLTMSAPIEFHALGLTAHGLIHLEADQVMIPSLP